MAVDTSGGTRRSATGPVVWQSTSDEGNDLFDFSSFGPGIQRRVCLGGCFFGGGKPLPKCGSCDPPSFGSELESYHVRDEKMQMSMRSGCFFFPR